jgi:hypothetical protein
VRRHLLRRELPDLPVVRDHIAPGNPRSKGGDDPVPEVFRRGDSPFLDRDQVFDELVDAEEEILFRQVGKPVFKRIFDIAPLVEDLGQTVPLGAVLAEHLLHEGEHGGVAGEDDVRPAGVEGEPLPPLRAAEPAVIGFRLEDDHVLPPLVQAPGKRHPGQPAAQYRRFHGI